MAHWNSYLYSIIAGALLCAVVSRLFAESKRKKLIRMLCGTVLGITLLQPMAGIRLPDWNRIWQTEEFDGAVFIAEGQEAAREARETIITEACETYILDRAEALGAQLRVRVTLNRDLLPESVTVQGETGFAAEEKLQEIITADLGIPKENQTWIWQQENSSF